MQIARQISALALSAATLAGADHPSAFAQVASQCLDASHPAVVAVCTCSDYIEDLDFAVSAATSFADFHQFESLFPEELLVGTLQIAQDQRDFLSLVAGPRVDALLSSEANDAVIFMLIGEIRSAAAEQPGVRGVAVINADASRYNSMLIESHGAFEERLREACRSDFLAE